MREEEEEMYDEMLQYIRNEECKSVSSVLKKKSVDVNVLLKGKGSLLHEAAYQGCTKCIRVLLKCGSFVNLSDDQGFTPLHAAVLGRNCPSIRLLVQNNALPNQVNQDGLSPCHLAVIADDMFMIHELVGPKGDPLVEGLVASPFQMAIDLNKGEALAYFIHMSSLLVPTTS